MSQWSSSRYECNRWRFCRASLVLGILSVAIHICQQMYFWVGTMRSGLKFCKCRSSWRPMGYFKVTSKLFWIQVDYTCNNRQILKQSPPQIMLHEAKIYCFLTFVQKTIVISQPETWETPNTRKLREEYEEHASSKDTRKTDDDGSYQIQSLTEN